MNKRYAIRISSNEDIPESSVVGKFYDPDRNPIAQIVLDTAMVEEFNQREMFVLATNDGPVVFLTKDKLRKVQLKSVTDFFTLYHEMGHIVLGHLSQAKNTPKKSRIQYIEEGRVMPEELEADIFAAKQFGYDKAISSLQELLKERHKWNVSVKVFSQTNFNAIKELILRIKHLEDNRL